ncbi:hypothetical protein PTQ38_26825 [Klebsiella michiganensis]|uniref:hypothetical protein n=1 Tax=Klebsiella michiganensis TaxID=1134687 RepID=UPI00287DCD52|nr:hypothetical protein [Klebsiella michiganensis]MDS7862031.1 hypothetical protein [Klebsiella michiganensis]
MTTDITELAQSLKRRAASANEFGEGLFFIKADDVLALVEALEELRAQIDRQEDFIREQDHLIGNLKSNLQASMQRTVSVKLPADRAAESEVSGYDGTEFYRAGWNARGKADKDALTAQGIKWEAE